MARDGRPGQRGGAWRASAAGLALAALVATACSGGGDGGSSGASKRRASSTTSTSILVASKVIGGGPVLDNGTTTFAVEGGTVKVLVPEGAVSKGSMVEVREVTGAPADLGAVQRGGNVYDLTVKNGKILTNKQISLEFGIAKPLPAGDPRPIGGLWDESDKVWRATNSDYPTTDTVTVFAFKPGKYSWLHWSWDKAVQAGTDTIRTLVGPVTATEGALRCVETDAVRTKFDLTSNTGNALAWCAGREDGRDVVRVRNNGQAPFTVRYKGFDAPTSTNASPLFAKLTAAMVDVWAPQDGENVKMVEPGDEVVFPLTDASTKGLLRAELNGFTQHYDVLSAAVAFTAGFYAGNAAVAAAVLEEPAVREALVAQLAGQGCVNGLGDTVTGGSYATDKLAAYAALLVRRCVDAETAALVVKAANRTALGSLRSSFGGAVPAQTEQQIDAAMRNALGPLVEPVGGPIAGEIIVSPKNTVASGGTTLAPTGTAPPVTPTVTPTTTATTVPTGTTGPTPTLVIATTTPATAPPVPTATTTTTAAPAATTTAAPTTTTTRATTTTTVAPTTTTTTPPLGPLVFNINDSPCGLTGGRLTASSSNFRPGWRWTATFFSPNNIQVPGSGSGDVADSTGSIAWSFNCSSAPEPGRYTVEIAEDCPLGTPTCNPRAVVRDTFEVYIYETRWAGRTFLPVCSGGGTYGSPGGVVNQTFVAGGTTISQVGVVNIERFTGTLAILSGEVPLRTWAINSNGGDIVLNGLITGLSPDETLNLRITVGAPAPPPNEALNFFYSNGVTAAGGQVTTSNSCPWTLPVPGLGQGIPAPPLGADLIGWVAT